MNNYNINGWNTQLEGKEPEEVLAFFLREFKGRIAFATSLGAEDQVLTKMIADIDPNTKIFTLDTGRLFQETFDLIEASNSRYKINIEVVFPDAAKVEEMVKEKGVNLFYKSVENRKLCCGIRKIKPLQRKLKDFDMWITGLRRSQSVTRVEYELVEVDASNGNILKLNPLINWSEGEVWDYLEVNNVPYNKLHDKGFPSIGCQPCTRAIKAGEDVRAGRWWWENPEMKECGLHQKK